MIRQLPNLLTCCNLLCGCVGIVFLLEDRSIPAAYFVWAACLFDFLDGFAARTLKVSSPIGKELDSLADVISFGVLPAMVIYKLWNADVPAFLPLVSFSVAAFSAIRLAIFNLDDSQADSFRGLPTPANAVLLTALPFQPLFIIEFIQQPGILIIIIALSSFLLVAPMDLFALKFKTFNWPDNKIRFTFLVLSVLLLAFLKLAALPLIIILYIGLSLGVRAFSR